MKMNISTVFYLCPTCFYASETSDDKHEHTLLRVNAGQSGDERRKPVTDREGRILSVAPRWFHEAIFEVRAASRS